MNSEYIDLKEVSRRLSLSSRTIRSWIKEPENPLPAYQIGKGKLFFKWFEVVSWTEGHRVEPLNVEETANRLLSSVKENTA